jgi:hypothetical protein
MCSVSSLVAVRASLRLDSRITPVAPLRQRHDALLTNPPDLLEPKSPLRSPPANKVPVLVYLVPADLLGRYLLLVEKVFDGPALGTSRVRSTRVPS